MRRRARSRRRIPAAPEGMDPEEEKFYAEGAEEVEEEIEKLRGK